jgi:hypothetical protein
VKEKLLKGMKVGDKTFKVHLDGYNITDALAGKRPARATSSSTSTTTARSSACVTTSGRSSSPSSARTASTSGGAVRAAALPQDLQPPLRPFETADHERWTYNLVG